MIDSDVEQFAETFSDLKVSNVRSEFIHRQNITSPLVFVTERFDPEQSTLYMEVTDANACRQKLYGKNVYQWFHERPMHTHSYIEIMIVLSGSIRNYIGEEVFTYQESQGCIMNHNIAHKEIPCEKAELLFVSLRNDYIFSLLSTMEKEHSSLHNKDLDQFLREVQTPTGADSSPRQYWDFSPVSDTADDTRRLLCQAVSSMKHHLPGNSAFCEAAILRYLYDLGNPEIYRLQKISAELNHQDYLVSKIRFLISASYGRISRKDLESQLSYQGDYLNRVFRKSTGQSISSACQEALFQHVSHLLKTTSFSIDEIMEQLHITSRGHFYKQFQKVTGMSPKEYRRANHTV